MTDLGAKLDALRRLLAGGRVNIAFSGGLDSRFLAHAAVEAGARVALFHVSGHHVPALETEFAEKWAKAAAIPFTGLFLNVLENPDIAANTKERCYHCKRFLFSHILERIKGEELYDGTNASDMSVFRPGLLAVRELGVRSPLAEAGFTKGDIHNAAKLTGLSNPAQPSAACLLTRFPYGVRPEKAAMEKLGKAENSIARLFEKAGLHCGFRLRLVRPGEAPELHVGAPLPPELAAAVLAAVQGDGLGLSAIRHVEKVSGFYDQGGNS